MVYARARHSYLHRSQQLLLDSDEKGKVVFLECTVLNPKQTKSSRRRNMFLPQWRQPKESVQKPGRTGGSSCAKTDLGLSCSGSLASDPLLPELAADGSLLGVNMDSATASRWLRCMLSKRPGSNSDDTLKMSSQGLKATCLSWTMKAAIPDGDQTLLGYHSRGKTPAR